MLIILILFFKFCTFGEGLNYTGNSYYFKTNGNNEFRIYNRIHFLNHNITDLDYNYNRRVENIQVLKADERPRIIPQKFFLDQEWDYTHKELNKTALPKYIHRLYESRSTNPWNKDTVRILFNDNRNGNSSIFKFNLNSLREDENITGADLFFYWPVENSSSIFKSSVVLRLYQIEKPSNENLNESNLVENPDIHKLFNVIYISKATKGWQTFKIKKPIDNWKNKEENLGLLLTISSFDENKLISVFNDTNQDIFRTFAVLTVHKNSSVPISNTSDPDSNSTLAALRHCTKRHWYVNFKKLHWGSVVVAPEEGFVSYDCAGRCSSIDDGHANHVKLINIFGTRTSCCVPTEFRPLPIMFFDQFENVIIKSYDNMVVTKCECR